MSLSLLLDPIPQLLSDLRITGWTDLAHPCPGDKPLPIEVHCLGRCAGPELGQWTIRDEWVLNCDFLAGAKPRMGVSRLSLRISWRKKFGTDEEPLEEAACVSSELREDGSW